MKTYKKPSVKEVKVASVFVMAKKTNCSGGN